MKKTIKSLTKKLNAIILAHNYQPPEIQDIADMCGDSLELSIKAANTKSDIIVFCGVRFMAETASILSPNKKILLPESNASCPMVDMITPGALSKYSANLPNVPIVTYVNSSAEIKAMSTICCTSANSSCVVNSLQEKEVLMIPDKNLAANIRHLTKKKIHTWDGYCPIHNRLTSEEVKLVKQNHPKAKFIAHPECRPDVIKMADACLSTSGMMRYVSKSNEKEFIIGTEIGLLYPMRKQNSDKKFYPAANHMLCPDMKMTSLNKILSCLKTMTGEVKVPEHIRLPALTAVKRMIDLSKL